MKKLILVRKIQRKSVEEKQETFIPSSLLEKELYDILLKDSNSNTAGIMAQNKSILSVYEKLKIEKGKKFKSTMIWDKYDVCPWCKKTIRVNRYCPVCKF